MTHLELIIKHFPKRLDSTNSLIQRLSVIAERANMTEDEIIMLCSELSDEFDNSFRNGIDAVEHL